MRYAEKNKGSERTRGQLSTKALTIDVTKV